MFCSNPLEAFSHLYVQPPSYHTSCIPSEPCYPESLHRVSVYLRVWYWLMLSSHICIPPHPTLQCPLSRSLAAGKGRLNTHMRASEEESLLQRGGGGWQDGNPLAEKERIPRPARASNRPALCRSSIEEYETALCKLDYTQSPGCQLLTAATNTYLNICVF